MEEETTGNVKVICRFRPLNEKEIQMNSEMCINFENDSKTVILKSDPQLRFTYDYVFTPFALQSEVYDISASPIISAVMHGFNGTVFAYGQTSSGKTFTMTGPNLFDREQMGIIPRMIQDVFEKIENSSANLEFTVKIGFCEIYMEKIKDLLDSKKINLKVHEDKTRGLFIENLTEKYVSNKEEVYEMLKFGTENREVASTNMNAGSSRSHSLFIVTITQTNSNDYSAKVGKLYLVDLAGSEKVGKTGAEGKRLEEAKTINKSLTMLGQVINALTDGKSKHIPYRDSKLTRVLQDSLGGNAKTALIVTCSPSPYNEPETISTLRFGIRAKAIKNKPKINREYTIAELKLMLAKAKDEIAKKDKLIKHLNRSLGKANLEFDENAEENESEESKIIEFDEVIPELEEIRISLAEETEKVNKYKQKLTEKTLDYENLKTEHEELKDNYNEIQGCYVQIQKDINDLLEDNEKLMISRDLLKQNNTRFENKILELEQTIIAKKVEIEHLDNLLTNNKITDLSRDLHSEKLKNDDLKSLIDHLQRENETIRSYSPNTSPSKLESSITDHQKCVDEKNFLISHLENRVKKVIHLEIAIDEIREQYSILESSLSQDSKEIKNKNEILEKNLEYVTVLYQKSQNVNSDLQLDNSIMQQKYNRTMDKYEDLEIKLAQSNEIIEENEKTIRELFEELSEKKLTNRQSGKIIKPIKGGLSKLL